MNIMNIWNITHTLALREELADERMKSRPMESKPFFYWHVERYALKKVRKTWVWQWEYVRDFHGTKAEAADLWKRVYRGKGKKYRLVMASRLGNR